MEIRIENVSKNFKKTKAVDKLTATIKDGELVSFLGPSGCGKSTTLFILAGLYNQDSGNIFFDGDIVDDLETEKRNIGMVFQNYALYPHMTVLKNILFPLEVKNIKKSKGMEKAEELMELLKISELRDRKPSELSGGQQQRVAIARALIKNPKVLLMDEPLSNLDAKLRVETREEIRRLQQHLKITTILVTHDQNEASSISDRILIMKDGRLQQFDQPREIYDNPKNLFTAKFMGDNPINIFPVKRSGDKYLISGSSQYLPKLGKLDGIDRSEFLVCARPDQLELTSLDLSSLHGVVDQVEMQGKDNLVRFKIGEASYRLHSDPQVNLEVGQTIGIKFKEDKIFAFDIETEESLLSRGKYAYEKE